MRRRSAGRGPGALIERATRELQWLFAAPRRRAASVLASEELEDGQALAAGRRALGELAELARPRPELAPAGGAELARWRSRASSCSAASARPGRRGGARSAGAARARVRALFLCGLQEGVFPAPARPAAVPGRGGAAAAGGGLGPAAGRARGCALAAERYLLYAAVSRPEELLVLSWHVADDDGDPTARVAVRGRRLRPVR